ncbi:transposase [Oxalobacter vibrioformis]|uniref:Transposase n=1 Tax=Oxalobacter vibrioformis TaxID=933080 RepID=A0A9E9M074_9BURK|nr:transposase [Oxalobacter vibrioformis]WAW10840.1 transposase [Oxalobacter vibrioformis]
MARAARLILPYQPHHILQKGNNRQPVFLDDEDHFSFLRWLREASTLYNVDVHAYVLMASRLHLLATPKDAASLGRMMQWVGRHYVPYFNKKYQRSGTLWEGRYRTSPIEAAPCFLSCSCFVELLPVRQGLVRRASDYRWSSYAHHTGLRQDPLIRDHKLYWELGNTPFAREAAYNRLISSPFSSDEADRISRAFEQGWPIGSEAFRLELERRTARKFRMGQRGRPAKDLVV